MLIATTDRLSQSLSEDVNERVKQRIKGDIEYYREHPEEIDRRLDELNREWPLERTFHTVAGGLALTGALLGAFRHRRWLILSAVPGIFLILHGLIGWAPPVEGLRRMGKRTSLEIDEERFALKEIKGEHF